MRTGCALAAIVVATAACGSSAAAPPPGAMTSSRSAVAHCGPAGAKTLAADSQARVYGTGGSVYGCAGGQRGVYLLGHGPTIRPGQDRVGVIALAGVDVGYAVTRMGVDTLAAQVIVRRLDTGRTLHDVSATTQPLGPEFFQSVQALVVKPDGAVAWVAIGGSIVRQGRETELDRLDRRGQARLDSGPEIDPHSLRLSGSRLSWRHGAAPRSATLL